jgi:cytochrome b561
VFSDVLTGNASSDGLSLPELHVSLGLFVLVLAVVRLVWRRTTPLPPWAEHLSAGERRLEGLLEKLLLALLFVVPATGLLLVAAGDDWLPVHVAAQRLPRGYRGACGPCAATHRGPAEPASRPHAVTPGAGP